MALTNMHSDLRSPILPLAYVLHWIMSYYLFILRGSFNLHFWVQYIYGEGIGNTSNLSGQWCHYLVLECVTVVQWDCPTCTAYTKLLQTCEAMYQASNANKGCRKVVLTRVASFLKANITFGGFVVFPSFLIMQQHQLLPMYVHGNCLRNFQ